MAVWPGARRVNLALFSLCKALVDAKIAVQRSGQLRPRVDRNRAVGAAKFRPRLSAPTLGLNAPSLGV